jgi:hypothetical protein
VNPVPGEEPISLEDVGFDGPQVRRRRGHAVKTFSQWIKNEPKEKWCLLFDEGGARHGIKTTNFAESYNSVLRGSRPLPLAGIIEFFMYSTMLYFHTRRQKVDEVMRNTQMRHCTNMTVYLNKAQDKALKHKVLAQPLYQSDENKIMWSYEVECKGKLRLGSKREKAFQIAELGNQICRCTCQKPLLRHIPCTHVIAVCYELQQFNFQRYAPWYYNKETIRNIWNQTIQGYLVQGSFTENPKKMSCTYQI